MAISMAQLLPAALMEAELFSSLGPAGRGEWNFRTIYSFRGQPDGSFPYGALLFDSLGNIYGTTYYGGANGIGSVYQLSPRAIGEWNESVLYSFQEGTDGNSPISNLVADASAICMGRRVRVAWAVAPSLS